MTEFEQNEQNPLEEHDFFIENTIEEEEGSSILKIAILVLVALGLLIGGYFLFFSGDTEKSVSSAETTEISNDTTTTNDAATTNDTTNALENAAIDPSTETSNTETDNNTETSSVKNENSNATNTNNPKNNTTTSTVSTNNINTDLHYFIIKGAFSEEANAQKSVDGLKTAGYNAIIVGKNKAGLFMVAYEGFATIGEAKTKLIEVRNTQEDAWIYKK